LVWVTVVALQISLHSSHFTAETIHSDSEIIQRRIRNEHGFGLKCCRFSAFSWNWIL